MFSKMKSAINWTTVFWASIERRADGLENPTFGREWFSAMIKLVGEAFRCGRDDQDHIEGSYIPITYQQY